MLRFSHVSLVLAVVGCVAAASTKLRLSPSASEASDLLARNAALEQEVKSLRAQLSACQGLKVGLASTKVAVSTNMSSVSVATSKTRMWDSFVPTYPMPEPASGQLYVVELNMPPLDAGMAPPSKCNHVTIPGSNIWGTPMAASTVEVDNGKILTYDDVVFGYNRIWQDLGIWRMQTWKGFRFFQDPMDSLALQQLLWKQQPDLVIELGTHGGGSAVYFAEIMRDYNPNALIMTVDPNPEHIPNSPLFHENPMIKYIQGYSNSPEVLTMMAEAVKIRKKVMVIHDAEHGKDPVLRDLKLYDPFVTVGEYFVVQDTSLDRTAPLMGTALAGVGTWVSPGGGGYGRYGVDKAWEYLMFSTNHNGFLRKVAP